jgi:hypothetical protein
MTYHRWRKSHAKGAIAAMAAGASDQTLNKRELAQRMDLENSRLRRVVTDLVWKR